MNSTASPYRIITVCTGNICRSPMAEFMLVDAFAAAGLSDRALVDSAGTTSYEVGRPIDPRAARVLDAHGIHSHAHVARKFRPEWFDERDLILALDVDHYGHLRELAPAGTEHKVRMLREFDPAVARLDHLDQGIEDPWFGDQSDFELTWELIDAAVPGVVEHVRAELTRRPPALAEA
ncbi:low molecular weight protein-tyrosine-phosphatase [Sinomonas sp. JGH33]|uniref:protein-tyrosine-phosphatase n=1 Tax=Sinomonas terricola TaxID=3110330 RepID=A0ABU5T475_9MICC|nr:low molecular weight protein-tyrosine-phosphatase [Sinomonas sp. JGH33]MEA5453951.1 low molecular weight protein-tyrosine-phosphatase [Sinomonas sp. JGH33]